LGAAEVMDGGHRVLRKAFANAEIKLAATTVAARRP